MDQLFVTADGSHSIISTNFEVAYHSKHGAIQESQHVFIDAGLQQLPKEKDITILEVGFGTGLNALLTALESQHRTGQIEYQAMEAYPVAPELLAKLNYTQNIPNSQDLFEQIHKGDWGKTLKVTKTFSILKLQMDFLQLKETNKFDLIYFDAFAPNAQPELWTTEALGIFINSLKPGGILTTYCAKGVVRRSFESLGCTSERIPGPPGKREMLRITKIFTT